MARPTLYVSRVADFGPALRDLRVAHAVSQADFADAIDMHASHVGSYERGTVVPSGRQLLRLLGGHNYWLALVPREAAGYVR